MWKPFSMGREPVKKTSEKLTEGYRRQRDRWAEAFTIHCRHQTTLLLTLHGALSTKWDFF
jgi:hypothetical protein